VHVSNPLNGVSSTVHGSPGTPASGTTGTHVVPLHVPGGPQRSDAVHFIPSGQSCAQTSHCSRLHVVPLSEPTRNPLLVEPSSAPVVASVAVVIDALVVDVLVVDVPTSAAPVDPLDASPLPALPGSATDGPHPSSTHNEQTRVISRT
jgi:hypothetical protein